MRRGLVFFVFGTVIVGGVEAGGREGFGDAGDAGDAGRSQSGEKSNISNIGTSSQLINQEQTYRIDNFHTQPQPQQSTLSTLENHHQPQDPNIDPNDPDNTNKEDEYQDQEDETQHSHYLHWTTFAFWRNAIIAASIYFAYISVFTCVGAFCSGMTVGLMSIETIQLQIMSLSKDQQERNIAQRILSVVSNHHLFLVTLLLANAIALESLPLIVHTLMPAWAAILFSTFVVLVAAEIIPQAFCTGPNKINIAYHAAPVVLAMIKIFWILAYPMAKGLDYLLGEHHHHRIQHKQFATFLTGGSQTLNNTQKFLLTSILELRTKRVPQIMISLNDLYLLSLTEKITPSKIKQINQKQYSYILVYKETRSNVVGVVKTKEFALKYLKSDKKNLTVESLFVEKQDILCVYEDTNLLEMLMLFQTRGERFSIVIGKKKKIQPGIQSIMYSKSDMVANNQEGQILGIVFLYTVFETISDYNNEVATALSKKHPESHNEPSSIQLTQLNKPLLHH